MTEPLFGLDETQRVEPLADGALVLRGFALDVADALARRRARGDGAGPAAAHGHARRPAHVGGDDQLRRRSAGSATARAIATTPLDPDNRQALAVDAAPFSRARAPGGRRGGLRRLRARCLPDQPLRSRHAAVAAPGSRRARLRRADRLGLARHAVPCSCSAGRSDRTRRTARRSRTATSSSGAARRGCVSTA